MRENKKAEILRLLDGASGSVSGQEICERFGVSRTAVWKLIQQLREEGYEIEAGQNRGYRLLGRPEILSRDELESRIRTAWAGRSVFYQEETDSTNDLARRLAEDGAPHGTLVVAGRQTAGKGRRGRSWSSPKDSSIYMTLLLRPRFDPPLAPMLTLIMGLSVVQGLREYPGVDTRIKWPNDAVLNGKKLCGILTEMSAQIDYINYVVIGIGINVNQKEFPEELSDIATSIYRETRVAANRAGIIAKVMEAFERNYERFCACGNLSALRDAYEEVLANRNQPVRVLDPKEPYEGVALGISDTGELLVRKADGTVCGVYSGEVSVRGLYSYV